MIKTALRLARVNTRVELVAAILLTLSYPCLLVAALLPQIWLFVSAAAVSYLTGWWLTSRKVRFIDLLSKVRAGISVRFLARELLLVLLLARMDLAESPVYLALSCFLLFYGLQAPHAALVALLRKRRTLPVVTRNIPLTWVRIPDPPPRLLLNRPAEKMLGLDLFAFCGLLATAATETTAFGYTGAGLTLALGLAYLLAVAVYVRRVGSMAHVERFFKGLDGWLREYRPRTVLYFSGSRTSAYQVNMWLETMARLERPLVILRERYLVPQLSPTSVPVLCIPSATQLMNIDLSTVRVALYPANVGKNIHMLRVPTMKHVFIGHGDSDKVASVNPYSKVYDEVWTAGRAGRDRYALADVGVRDEDIVEVGRPQLAPVRKASGGLVGPIPTVLYAPTWEGWTDDPGNTSLILAGENIVRKLITADPPVRVLYKPHPFTGTRSRKAAAAHERIVAMLERASAERAAEAKWQKQAAEDAAARQAARARMEQAAARLAKLETATASDIDEALASRDGITPRERLEEIARLRQEWNDAYWQSFGWWEHRVITGARPHLYDCFNVCDLMVSDISSVVSDFIASGKPYAIANTSGLSAEEFKRQNSAARAATILTPKADELPALLEAVRSGVDELAQARRELKEYLLGPDQPDSMSRFAAAVDALAAKAESRNERVARMDATESGTAGARLPKQRTTDTDLALGLDDRQEEDGGGEDDPDNAQPEGEPEEASESAAAATD